MENKVFHGSDIEVIEKNYGINKDEIINFSSNVNPKGMPMSVKEAIIKNVEVLERYPDRNNNNLFNSINHYTKANKDKIVVGNGVSEVMKYIISAINPKKSIIIMPTYSEYEKELKKVGCDVSYFLLDDKKDFMLDIDGLINELKNNSYDLLVICNPNNPTSTFIENDLIIDICKENDIYILVDETYIEFIENYSYKKSAITLIDSYDGLIVMRGVSKFFALAGIRFGYCVTNNKFLLEEVSKNINTWSVNSLVDVCINALAHDEKYINEVSKYMSKERDRVIVELKKIDKIQVYEPKANFVLIKILDKDINADILFENAILKKLMIRNCSSFYSLDDTFFRICFLNEDENNKLIKFLNIQFD